MSVSPVDCMIVPLAIVALSACAHPQEPIAEDGWGPGGRIHAGALSEPQRRPAPRPTAVPVEARKRWVDADQLDSLRAVGSRGPSEHLDGSHERTVLTNKAAAAYAHLSVGTVVPNDALIAQRHHPADSEAIESWFIMQKRADNWQFVILDPQLRVAAGPPLDLCRRCHQDAPHDHLFGPNKQQRPPGLK